MLPHTKRQQQVSKLPRKKGHFAFQEEAIEEWEDAAVQEAIGEWEGAADIQEVLGEWEGAADIQEVLGEWQEEELREFEEVGKRFIHEVLCWHKGAGSSFRTVYTGISRTTNWRLKKGKKRKKN